MSEAIGLRRAREILEAKLREQATLQALLSAQRGRRSMSWSRRRAGCSMCRSGGSWRIRAWGLWRRLKMKDEPGARG